VILGRLKSDFKLPDSAAEIRTRWLYARRICGRKGNMRLRISVVAVSDKSCLTMRNLSPAGQPIFACIPRASTGCVQPIAAVGRSRNGIHYFGQHSARYQRYGGRSLT
jgi:hypothetical protein